MHIQYMQSLGGNLIKAVKNGMRASTSFKMYFAAIIHITYRTNNRITSSWRNTLDPVKCIFNEGGRFSARATAMTSHLNFHSRTGNARIQTENVMPC